MTATELRESGKTTPSTKSQETAAQKRELISAVRSRGLKQNTNELRLERAPWQRDSESSKAEERPALICLPGLDGSTLPSLIEEQQLSDNFNIFVLKVPGTSRLDHDQIIDFLAMQVKQSRSKHVLLLGHSVGSLLALGLARRCPKQVKGLVLLDPIAALPLSPLSVAGAVASSLALSPFGSFLGSGAQLDSIARAAMDDMIGSEGGQDIDWEQTRFRMERWVDQGVRRLKDQIGAIETETLILTSSKNPPPSVVSEAARLKALLPHATLSAASKLDRGGSEPPLSLDRLLRLSKLAPRGLQLDPVLDFLPPPFDTPLPQTLAAVKRLFSPVWFSTEKESGAVEQGLQHLPPLDTGRPVLFVGNHQYLGIESAVLVEGIRDQTEAAEIVRALAHPFIFEDDIRKATLEGNFYANFGTVPVSPRNYHKLISNGRPTLLFPGGAPEAFHGSKDAYKLRWPSTTDFLPLAARYNATIVPFGGVGAWEGFTSLGETEKLSERWQAFEAAVAKPLRDLRIHLNLTELALAPGMRPGEVGRGRGPPRQVRGAAREERLVFNVPRAVAVPNPPWEAPRYYFYFGKPIDTSDVDCKDKAQTAEVYAAVRKDVEDCIKYLLRKRLDDPYAKFSARIQYELLTGKQAPTFDP